MCTVFSMISVVTVYVLNKPDGQWILRKRREHFRKRSRPYAITPFRSYLLPNKYIILYKHAEKETIFGVFVLVWKNMNTL